MLGPKVNKDYTSPFFTKPAALEHQEIVKLLNERLLRLEGELEKRKKDNASFRKADEAWLRSLFKAVFLDAEKKLGSKGLSWKQREQKACLLAVRQAFDSKVETSCSSLWRLLQVSPAERKVGEAYLNELKEARKRVSKDMEAHRRILRDLKAKVLKAQEDLTVLEFTAKAFQKDMEKLNAIGKYPAVPPPIEGLVPSREGVGLPDHPGVYFLWKDGLVEYVGRSVSLKTRVKTGHHALKPEHKISYLLFDMGVLDWAEYYYIGLCCPPLNGGVLRRRVLQHQLEKEIRKNRKKWG
jgi:hypothetical protein